MLRLTTRVPLTHFRTLHTSLPALAGSNSQKPATSQGHASLDKKAGLDVQSATAQAGKQAKHNSESSSTTHADESGEAQPFDAARQGGKGGESKGGDRHRGAFKDQVGGQDEAEKGKGVETGGQESAGGGVLEGVKNVLGMGTASRKFSTLSTLRYPASAHQPDSSNKSSKPHQSTDTLPADQNPHLKHTPKGSSGSQPSGNASSNPSLPSHNSTATPATGKTGVREFSTSSFLGRPADVTGKANSQGDSAELGAMDKRSGDGADGEKRGGHLGTPQASSGETPASKDVPTGTGAPDPEIPKDQAQNAKKGVTHSTTRQFSTLTQTRSFSTTRVAGYPTDPTGKANAQGDAAKGSMDKQSSSPLGEKGGNAGSPKVNTNDRDTVDAGIGSKTNAPDPEIKQGESENASKGMLSGGDKAVRRYSTLSTANVGLGLGRRAFGVRGYAANPPGGYAKAYKGEGNDQGYTTPSTALPSNLDSAYKSNDSSAAPSPDSSLKPSSELEHSSSAVEPPNEALRAMAKEGTLGDKNGQPEGKIGEIGLDEAWKHRK